ncbi:SIMPL domain-containing protein [Roseomonas sp. E05]|uniref:SIMPL domain-containing protein n=1 Tax=Roseomonas sp. E05 TaxID=3046310 RepID=UPI0024BB0773|nr:SIMPL domain-containing protein [Roseomonas sp. E05]MDJ0389399.1 SIMPL domain-containing protein [Roseomonas sp. E05]
MVRPSLPALALGGIVAAGSAWAQAPAPAAAPEAATVLTLSETAEVLRAPDEVRATLRVEARGASAAAVQAQVNGAMAKALEQARGVQGVQASTGGYWTSRNEEKRDWTATQTLMLRSTEATPLLELTGALQGQGLAMAGLDWTLSRPREVEARKEAGEMAITALRQRAEAVAGQLGLHVANLRKLQVDVASQPMPRMRVAMMAARQEAAPPVSAPEAVPVSATVSGEFVLRP